MARSLTGWLTRPIKKTSGADVSGGCDDNTMDDIVKEHVVAPRKNRHIVWDFDFLNASGTELDSVVLKYTLNFSRMGCMPSARSRPICLLINSSTTQMVLVHDAIESMQASGK